MRRDPTDDKFLEVGRYGHAGLIVSGNADLLALNPFHDIPILTPAMSIEILPTAWLFITE